MRFCRFARIGPSAILILGKMATLPESAVDAPD